MKRFNILLGNFFLCITANASPNTYNDMDITMLLWMIVGTFVSFLIVVCFFCWFYITASKSALLGNSDYESNVPAIRGHNKQHDSDILTNENRVLEEKLSALRHSNIKQNEELIMLKNMVEDISKRLNCITDTSDMSTKDSCERLPIQIENVIDRYNQIINQVKERDKKIVELNACKLRDRDVFATSLMRKQDEIKVIIESMFELVEKDEDSIYYNRAIHIYKDFNLFHETISKLPLLDSEESLEEVRKQLRKHVVDSMQGKGWINTAYIIDLYMSISNTLYDKFSQIGISVASMHLLISLIYEYLGMLGIKVLLPYLLVENYDRDRYNYEAERWINRFDPAISDKFSSKKIVDLDTIGYQIEGGELVKPIINYTI